MVSGGVPVSGGPDGLDAGALLAEVVRQRVVIAERDATIAEQRATIGSLVGRVDALVLQVEELRARVGANSRNSSKPPSSDGYAKPVVSPGRAGQRAAGRKPGKQPGSPGAALRQVEHPDQVVEHAPADCRACGASLRGAPVVAVSARQVFDLPPVAAVVVEHRLQRRRCGCGAETEAAAPPGAGAAAVYGPGVRALAVYLMHVQHLPLARTAQLLDEVFGVPVSQGFLAAALTEAGQAAGPFVDAARARLIEAPVVHFDETGIRVAGSLGWMHTACTATLTLLAAHSKRGRKAMDDIAVLPGFTGVAVHDGLSAYRKYPARHALCNAHHIRELAAVTERDATQQWAADLTEVLLAANRAAHQARDQGRDQLPAPALAELRADYNRLIAAGQAQNPRPAPTGRRGAPKLGKTGSLLRRLDQRRDEVLRFATDLTVPFTNNQAERDLRMVKVQMKISGCWRTSQGARTFANLRSYTSTARKNKINLLEAITDLVKGNPWIPQTA